MSSSVKMTDDDGSTHPVVYSGQVNMRRARLTNEQLQRFERRKVEKAKKCHRRKHRSMTKPEIYRYCVINHESKLI